MSAEFDGVDDYMESVSGITVGERYSISAWFDADTMGPGSNGGIVGHGSRLLVSWGGEYAVPKLVIFGGWSAPIYRLWYMAAPFSAITGWKWMMVTYDFNGGSHQPTLYTLEGNTFATLTVANGGLEDLIPSTGVTPYPDGGVFSIGSQGTVNWPWDGRIAEVGLWSRVFTETEAQAICVKGPMAISESRRLYWPLDFELSSLMADLDDYSGGGGYDVVAFGPGVGANPPTYPAGLGRASQMAH